MNQKRHELSETKERNEIWFVSKARRSSFSKDDPEKTSKILKKFDNFIITKGDWHQITNPFNENCHLIEIQYGDRN